MSAPSILKAAASSAFSLPSKSYRCVIGLECHISLFSPVKLFSASHLPLSGTPNHHISAFDLSMPGALPVLNVEPVRQAIVASKVLKGWFQSSESLN
jgi:Asp-tRNA(Asn)/Glu-tRNA(Gln) amidotransferase B subunit